MEKARARGVVSDVRLAGGDPEILRVSEDSRQVKAGDLFVARSGTKRSGLDFAAEAIAKGGVAVVSEELLSICDTIAFARVSNANIALGVLAHEAAGNPTRGMKMIAVTGTKGKTTVAYLVRSILKAAGKRCGLVGTVEIDDGHAVIPAEMTTPGVVELAAFFGRLRDNGGDACVMEVSSHALHQHRVAGINFDVAIFTNLTGDHLDYHKTMDEYGDAKAMLFDALAPDAVAIINADDAYADRMVRGCRGKIIRYGVGTSRDWSAEIISMTSVGMRLRIYAPGGITKEFDSPLVGRHNVYNTLCAMAATFALGIPLEVIFNGLDDMEGVPGRLQAVVVPGWSRGATRFQVFVDYAHTHDSLENVLTALRATMKPGARLICLFGCGGDRDRTKRPKMAAVAERLADRVIVTSDNPRTEDPLAIIAEIQAGFSGTASAKIVTDPDRGSAIRTAIAMADSGDVVLLAGKGHENYQIVGTTKHHFDDVEEAALAMAAVGK